MGYINLGGYHDLYVQLDTLLLADVFEKLEYPKNLLDLHKDLSFLAERRKLGNMEKLLLT